jgi:hypothetical protein
MVENIISKIKIGNVEYDLKVETDDELKTDSTNPVQNKIVAAKIQEIEENKSQVQIITWEDDD